MKRMLLMLVTVLFTGCATNPFVSSWRAPDAVPLTVNGTKVVAVVMVKEESSRREAEDTLAAEITARGAIGIPMYTLFPDEDPTHEAQARAVLEKAGVAGAVVMRPIGVHNEITATPVTYMGPTYGSYWGGYYGRGWGGVYAAPMMMGTEIQTNTIVSVETLVYSFKQNKLVWGGESRSTNPSNMQSLIKQLAAAATDELKQQGLITP